MTPHLLAVCRFILLIAAMFPVAPGSDASPAANAPEGSFPDSISCSVQPWYRHRPDGTPGREIRVHFKGPKLQGTAALELVAEGKHETLTIDGRGTGLDSLVVLLPPGVGVDAAATVKAILTQHDRRLEEMISVPPMRHWKVYIYPHSHVDIGYSNTHDNVEFIHKRNIDQGIKLAEETRRYPDGARYLWNTEVMWPFERYYRSARPEQRSRLVQAVRRGALCLDAAYVNILTSNCNDEEMMQSLRPRREAAGLTGQPIDTYVQVDIPGMAWGLVPVLAHEGIRYVMLMPNGGRGNDSMVSRLRQKPFWWLGPDGTSRILFLNAGGYNAGMRKGGKTGRPWFGQRDRERIPEVIRTENPRADFLDETLFRELPLLEKEGHPYDLYVVTWAMWDNALLDADLPKAVKSWNEDYAYPRLEIASAHKIVSTFERRYGDRLPTVSGDFTEYWTDGFGTAARQTRMSRNANERLVQAETIWPMLHPGKPAPREQFDEAWRYGVLCTEHTFTYENPSEPYFQEAIWKMKQRYFQEVDDRSQALLDDALAPATDKSNGALGPAAGPSNGGVAVLNTHSWPHGGLVTLSPAESQAGDRVIGDDGREVMSQRLSTGELAFLCPEVPAFASLHFRVVAGTCTLTSSCRFTATALENETLRVKIDPATGNITHFEEKSSGKNFADASVNGGLNAFRWQPAKGAGNALPDSVVSIVLKESGPLLGEVQIVSHAPGCRSVVRSVRLVHGRPDVEITDVVDKLPLLPKDGIHFGFGFALPDGKTRVDIPWAVMELEKDQWPAANRAWTAAQHFVDISNDSAGVTWCSPDAPLIESGSITANNTGDWDGVGDIWPSTTPPSSTIYSWVMNNHWYTNTPLTQDGPVAFRYRMLPHGRYDPSRANRFGVEQAQPLIAIAADRNPIQTPLVGLSGDRTAVTILKSSGDGKATILRVRSFSNEAEVVKFTWPAGTPRRARVCDLGEEPGETDALNEISVPAWSFVTVLVEW